jgi:phenylacetate-CoA ligase
VASPTAIVELVVDAEDPHSKVIEENGVAGDIVVTSLIRHLTPVVRYPAGDRAEWVDREKGLFRLLGRVQNSIRLGPVSLDATELRALASRTLHPSTVAAFQTVVKREDGKDSLLCRIALAEEEANGHNGADLSHATNGEASAEQRVLNALWEERPMLLQHVQMGMIRVEVEICEMRDMAVNKRSGKLMSVVQ